MNHITKRRAAAIMSVALLAAVAACGKKADDAAVAVDTSAMTTPAMTALRVTEIETGKALDADKSVAADMDDFGVRDTVYAAVKTEGAGSGVLAAKWTFQDGQTVGESTQNIAPTADAWHEFHIQKATAWPKGNYKVEVTLDGVAAGSEDFAVK